MGCGTIIIVVLVSSALSRADAPWWMYLVLVAPIIWWALSPAEKAVEVPKPDQPDIEKMKADIRRQIMAELVDAHKKLAQREMAVYARETRVPAIESDVSSLKPGSLKLIRNTLMKLHEARRTDEVYQTSSTCKEANAILQGLNGMIGKKRGAA